MKKPNYPNQQFLKNKTTLERWSQWITQAIANEIYYLTKHEKIDFNEAQEKSIN